jgi:hypothetical protein
VGATRVEERIFTTVITLTEHLCHIAEFKRDDPVRVALELWRLVDADVRCKGVGNGQDRIEGLVLDLDQLDGFLCDRFCVGADSGNGIADVAHPVDCQCVLVL